MRPLSLLRILFFITLLLRFSAAHSEAGVGHLGGVHYAEAENTLTASGWVASGQPNVFITNIIVEIDGRQAYRGRMQLAERPDVVQVTGRQDWLLSGFRVSFPRPDSLQGGTHAVHARARLSNGSEFTLAATPEAASLTLPARNVPGRAARLAMLLALALPLAALLGARRANAALHRRTATESTTFEKRCFSWSLLLSFCLLVVTGATGSSLTLLFGHSPLASHDAKPWLGTPQPIRSDEWEVITPMAISQGSHVPAFPVINQNWGSDGHNMLVVGMTGVPVAHFSAIAKPATWGFFFLDLRRALAWYWWLPFFGCLFALWLVFLRFFDLEWKISAGLAAAFAFSPYAVAFSGWPAYAALFPLAGLLFAQGILQSQRLAPTLIHGALLGISIGGFALTLYPAWQISLGYALLPLGLAWCWSQRRQLQFGRHQWLGILAALVITFAILGSWLDDAMDAVQAIRNTVYPGSRVFEVGGDIDPWFFIKGLMSLQTMYRPTQLMDPSDAGSFVFLPLALLVAGVLAFRAEQRTRAMGAVLALYMLAVTGYMFAGSTPLLARWSLWGAVTSYRLDLALGLSQVLFMGWIFSRPRAVAPPPAWLEPLGWAVGLSTVVWGLHLHRLVPSMISSELLEPVKWLSLLAWGGLSYWIVTRRHLRATAVFCLWMLAASLPFNPLGRAITGVAIDQDLIRGLERAALEHRRAEVAVIDERTWSLVLPMAGQQVTNSVFYHPPEAFWARMDPEHKAASIYNRYQRLFFKLQALDNPEHFAIHSPRLDEVTLTMDPYRFDFRKLGAKVLLSPRGHEAELAKNDSLEYVQAKDPWVIFRIKN